MFCIIHKILEASSLPIIFHNSNGDYNNVNFCIQSLSLLIQVNNEASSAETNTVPTTHIGHFSDFLENSLLSENLCANLLAS